MSGEVRRIFPLPVPGCRRGGRQLTRPGKNFALRGPRSGPWSLLNVEKSRLAEIMGTSERIIQRIMKDLNQADADAGRNRHGLAVT